MHGVSEKAPADRGRARRRAGGRTGRHHVARRMLWMVILYHEHRKRRKRADFARSPCVTVKLLSDAVRSCARWCMSWLQFWRVLPDDFMHRGAARPDSYLLDREKNGVSVHVFVTGDGRVNNPPSLRVSSVMRKDTPENLPMPPGSGRPDARKHVRGAGERKRSEWSE